MMSEHPELDKMQSVSETSNKIGEFLDYLFHEKGYVLCYWRHNNAWNTDHLEMVGSTTEKLLAEYYNVDLDKAEKERQAILDSINKSTEQLSNKSCAEEK